MVCVALVAGTLGLVLSLHRDEDIDARRTTTPSQRVVPTEEGTAPTPLPQGTSSGVCVEWVSFASPAEAMADATLVVTTTGPAASAGTVEIFAVDAAVHRVDVDGVLKGADVTAGDSLDIVSTPVTCAPGGIYPNGDPLDAAGPLVLFLHRDEGSDKWRTFTPTQGVVSIEDGKVPTVWPPGSEY